MDGRPAMTRIEPNWAVTDVHQSDNYDEGRPAGPPTGIVIHWWGLPEWNQTHDGVVDFLCNGNRSARTSAHYVVSAGRITQIVSDNDRAWHCSGNNLRSLVTAITFRPPVPETIQTNLQKSTELQMKENLTKCNSQTA